MTARTILVLEDEALIALDIEETLLQAGYEHIVLCHDVASAMAAIEAQDPAFAFLDLNLGHDETSICVARELARREVAFCFLSGYTRATVALPDDLANRPRMTKPFKSADLIRSISIA